MSRIIIVGGGAAGFFAALACADAGYTGEILILEKTAQFLSKVKISGGGRCNVTHALFNEREFAMRYPRGERALIAPFKQFQASDTVAWFAARGITVRRVMSDNGSGYVSRAFRAACETAGLRHLRTRAYTPRTNGKAERFIQTLQREWAYVRPYQTSAERRAALRPWVRYYNEQRPHASLSYEAPSSRLRSAA